MVFEALSPASTSVTVDTNAVRNPLLTIPPNVGGNCRTTMYYTIIIILLIAYVFTLYQWNKRIEWRLNIEISKWFKILHYSMIGLIIIDIAIFSISGFHYRGLWTSRIFVFGFLLSGLTLYPLANKSILNKIERIYFLILGYSPVGVGLFLLVPFLGLVVTVSIGGRLISPAEEILYEDSNIRIQQTFTGALGSLCLDLVEKKLIVEGPRRRLHKFDLDSYDSIYVQYDSDSIRVRLTSEQYWEFESDTIFVDDIYFEIENRNNIPPTLNKHKLGVAGVPR